MDREDVEKIRKAVEGKTEERAVPHEETPTRLTVPPKPEVREKFEPTAREKQSKPEIRVRDARVRDTGMDDRDVASVRPESMPGPTDFAPLFVKVEKYRETIIALQELKSYLSGIREIFEVVKDLEELRQTSVEMILSSIERVEVTIGDLDMLLLKPPGVRLEGYAKGMEDVEKIELSMIELHKEIESLRDRLAKLKAK